jgi:hypothetical protein
LNDREKAQTEIRAVLEGVAQSRNVVTYSGLVGQITALHLEPDSPLLASMLDDISRASDADNGCMLSAVVVHKNDNELPGKGFYALAKSLDREVEDELSFHVQEVGRVHDFYSSQHP